MKTLKRDHLRVSPVPDAGTALGQIAGGFDDDKENHPQSGLRTRSPARSDAPINPPRRPVETRATQVRLICSGVESSEKRTVTEAASFASLSIRQARWRRSIYAPSATCRRQASLSSALRRSSRKMVEAARPSAKAIARSDRPLAFRPASRSLS